MQELTKKQKREAETALEEIRTRGRPLLVGFGGSIAYGLNTPRSDVDIRGIFLNTPEEFTGLRTETEQLRLEGSDTVLYGLRKAMRLLLDCNPNVIELLGLRPEHVLICSEEGRMILDRSYVFLSKRAIWTFGGYATSLRKKLQTQVYEGKTDARTLSKEMSHLIRIYAMGIELLDGQITTFREREHDLLMEIRGGRYLDRHRVPTQEYERLLEDYIGGFNAAAIRTRLPAEPDREAANSLTMEIVYRSL